ncbi:preprotein translocase subunit YajC [Caviibacter abscessus]|uniref:preprotein translocase subunit YajC n=1 Tax=Caviibacter abscessus TaxID=1766719 RepID=UPI00082B96DD|nr:preprotein translocase subunit YajC [Caviibacter abscessus]
MNSYILKILLSYVVLAVIIFLPTILSNRNRRKRIDQMQNNLKIGDNIETIGGIHGSIIKVLDEIVEIRIDKGVSMTISKNAVARVKK